MIAEEALPTDPVACTLCEASGRDTLKTDLHHWKDVIRGIDPTRDTLTSTSASSMDTVSLSEER